jgi:hypothetical protein
MANPEMAHRKRRLAQTPSVGHTGYMKQKLPIGIQDFATIREDGFLYVDKTARIHELATGSGKVFFLSRPRRFGKSLLCSTLFKQLYCVLPYNFPPGSYYFFYKWIVILQF